MGKHRIFSTALGMALDGTKPLEKNRVRVGVERRARVWENP
jgi:hypothetical protein